MARDADLKLSPHFPKTRSGQGAPGATKVRRTPRRKPTNGAAGPKSPGGEAERQQVEGDTYTVDLKSGGSVSVVVKVNLFGLTTEDRNFVIDLVDKLKGYPSPTGSNKNGPSEEGPSGQPSGDGGGVTPT